MQSDGICCHRTIFEFENKIELFSLYFPSRMPNLKFDVHTFGPLSCMCEEMVLNPFMYEELVPIHLRCE